MPETPLFRIGDLVVFQASSITVIRNSIGIVVGTELIHDLSEEIFSKSKWYVVQFGSMRLIVSDDMIKKIEGHSDNR